MCSKTSKPSLKVLQLVSIFENEESKTKLKFLSQGGSTATVPEAAPTSAARHSEPEPSSSDDAVPEAEAAVAAVGRGGDRAEHSNACASGVAVTKYVGGGGGCGWMERPERNLLFVIHPWCMLRKSDTDRQSEFPPPGFLERLKAKLLALHRETDEPRRLQCPAAAATVKRRRNNNQRIKCWFQYTAAVAALQRAGLRAKAITTGPGGRGAKVAAGPGRVATAANPGGSAVNYRTEPVAVQVDFLVDRGVNDY